MKKKDLIKILFFLILSIFELNAQTFEISPQKPKLNQEIIITYTPDKIFNADKYSVNVVIYKFSKRYYAQEEFKMQKQNNIWKLNFTPEDSLNFVAVKFKIGKKTDNNEEEGYFISFFNEAGDTLPNSKAGYAACISGWGRIFGLVTKPNESVNIFNRLFEKHHELKIDYTYNYLYALSTSDIENKDTIIANELVQLEKADANSENLDVLIRFYGYLKNKEKAEFFKKKHIELFPKGVYAREEHFSKFNNPKTADEQAEFARQATINFDLDKNQGYTIRARTLSSYLDEKKFEKALEYVNDLGDLSTSQLYLYLTSKLYNANSFEICEKAAARGIEKGEKELKQIPANDLYYSPLDYENFILSQLAELHNIRALINSKIDLKKAILHSQKAYKLSKGSSKSINENYVSCLIMDKENDKALEILRENIIRGSATKNMQDSLLQEAYTLSKGSLKGYEEFSAEINKQAKEELKTEIAATLIKKKAPDFSLTDLDGKSVTLTDFKDKIVILDFWATWCGPCKASFPGMKKAVKKYADNPNIQFLFINVWERGDDATAKVKEFITENDYPFYVLRDFDGSTPKKYNVNGIPTKCIIDTAGYIRYQHSGGDSDIAKAVNEITTVIEIIK